MGAITRGFANNILSGGTVDATDGLTGTIPASNITNTSVSAVTSMPASVGDFIEVTATDPTPVGTEGQVWYNSTSGTFKTALGSYGVWASGGNMNTARTTAGAGTQTAGLAFGGGAGSTPYSAATEEYDGTSWTSSNSMNTARQDLGGTGTQTAALAFGGDTPTPATSTGATELYNGTSWTSNPTGLNAVREYIRGGAGTQTAALTAAGYRRPAPAGALNSTESWNGTSWTTVPATVNTARFAAAIIGTQTAALMFGGTTPPLSAATESYNGTSWTTVNSLNTARSQLGGAGTQTAGLGFGGYTPPTNSTATEKWNGTSWTSNPTGLTTGRYAMAAAGTQTSALSGGGFGPTYSTATELWTQSVVVPVAGSWSSGGSLPASKFIATGFGSQTAAIIAGGDSGGSIVGTAFTYNGTSWSPSPSLNTPRSGLMGSSNAPQTTGVVFGGYTTYPTMLTATENWNGSVWTNNPTGLNTARQNGGGAGIQTAAICVGGEIPGPAGTNSSAVENYNGTSWTTSPVTFPSSGPGIRGFGLQTAAIFIKSGVSQSWNGTAFSTAGTQNNPSNNRGVFGIQTAGIAAGVQASPPTGATEIWNGTAWTSNPNSLATSRYGLVGFGTQSSGLGSGGYTGTAYSTATEEWTGPSTTLNYKTLTTS